MAKNKNQHFVPQYYFKYFSKDKKTICVFNLKNHKYIPSATIKGQCSKNYFYGKNIRVEEIFSNIEMSASKIITKIIREKTLSSLSESERRNLMSDLAIQYGRTKKAKQTEESLINYLTEKVIKPEFFQYARKNGLDLSLEDLEEMKISMKSQHSPFIAMISGALLYDLEVVLLENETEIDFIFSDNPVVFCNSFFNNKVKNSTEGMASKGLQIYYPICSQFAIFAFDSNYYEFSSAGTLKLKKESDIKILNGLQILYCNESVYFEDQDMHNYVQSEHMPLLDKRPSQKIQERVVNKTMFNDGSYEELLSIGPQKIFYNLEQLSILIHKNNSSPYGMRNQFMVEMNSKIIKAINNKEITSAEDYDNFVKYHQKLDMERLF